MKKVISGFLICILACFCMTGCGKDPVAKELESFANDDMAKINVSYDDFIKDYAKASNYASDKEKYVDYINNTLIKELDDITNKVNEIKTEHKEITDLKNKYLKVISGYRRGIESCSKAIDAEDATALEKANEQITNVSKDLEDYNSSLKSLAKEYDMKVLDPSN